MREAIVRIADSEFDTMGLGDLVRLWDDAGVRNFDELECHGTGALVQVETDAPVDEAALAGLDCVNHWDRIADGEAYRYLVDFTAPDLPEVLSARSDELVGTCDPEVEDGGATMSLVGEQETISETIGDYQTAGVTPDLRSLGGYDGSDDPLDSLTDRQREVIQTAYGMGYFEVPRTATTDDVATELGLDSSTVAEHLQRAERNLLGPLLAGEE